MKNDSRIYIQDKLANLAAQTEILWSTLEAIHDAMEGKLWANIAHERVLVFARWFPADYPLIISVTPLPFSCFKLVSKL